MGYGFFDFSAGAEVTNKNKTELNKKSVSSKLP